MVAVEERPEPIRIIPGAIAEPRRKKYVLVATLIESAEVDISGVKHLELAVVEKMTRVLLRSDGYKDEQISPIADRITNAVVGFRGEKYIYQWKTQES